MPVKTGGVKKYWEYVSFILTHCYWIVSFAYHGGIPSLTCLFWLTYLILHIPCPVKLQQHFDPPDHIPTKPGSIPLLFPGYLSLLLLPVHLLLVHLSQLCWSLSFLFYATSGLFLQTIHSSSDSTKEHDWLCQKPFLK